MSQSGDDSKQDIRKKLLTGLGVSGDRLPKNYTYIYGSCFTELLKNLLLESGYNVIPFGWETFLSFIKTRVKTTTSSTEKMRYSPDLIAYDDATFEFIEVKARSRYPFKYSDNEIFRINKYKQYWPEAYLIMVIPYKHWFYAQRFCEINMQTATLAEGKPESTREDHVDINNFHLLEEIFPKITGDIWKDVIEKRFPSLKKEDHQYFLSDIFSKEPKIKKKITSDRGENIFYKYKLLASSLFSVFAKYEENTTSCPELYPLFDKETPHNKDLLAFVKDKNVLNDDEQLFKQYSRECLVPREYFDIDMKILRERKLI